MFNDRVYESLNSLLHILKSYRRDATGSRKLFRS